MYSSAEVGFEDVADLGELWPTPPCAAQDLDKVEGLASEFVRGPNKQSLNPKPQTLNPKPYDFGQQGRPGQNPEAESWISGEGCSASCFCRRWWELRRHLAQFHLFSTRAQHAISSWSRRPVSEQESELCPGGVCCRFPPGNHGRRSRPQDVFDGSRLLEDRGRGDPCMLL